MARGIVPARNGLAVELRNLSHPFKLRIQNSHTRKNNSSVKNYNKGRHHSPS